jgi:CheY-like chemotaxis protein
VTSKSVLVAEPDAKFLLGLSLLLTAAGYRVLWANTAREALSFIEDRTVAIDLFIVNPTLSVPVEDLMLDAIHRRPAPSKILALIPEPEDYYLEIAQRMRAHGVLLKPSADEILPKEEWLA